MWWGREGIYDPYVSRIDTVHGEFISESSLNAVLRNTDCVLIITDHDQFKKIDLTCLKNKVVVDCKNVIDNSNIKKDVIYLKI